MFLIHTVVLEEEIPWNLGLFCHVKVTGCNSPRKGELLLCFFLLMSTLRNHYRTKRLARNNECNRLALWEQEGRVPHFSLKKVLALGLTLGNEWKQTALRTAVMATAQCSES